MDHHRFSDMLITHLVAGGQTGADIAALDTALELGIPCGGWVPHGRTNEAGLIPPHYPNLKETPSSDPRQRTELNVRDSDATVIFSHGMLRGGSLYTRLKAFDLGKPVLHIDLDFQSSADAILRLRRWLDELEFVRILNVAGPRASVDPLIYDATKQVLTEVLKPLHQPDINS